MIVNTIFKFLAIGLAIFVSLHWLAWQVPLLKWFLVSAYYWISLVIQHNLANDVDAMLKGMYLYIATIALFAIWGFSPWDWKRKLSYGLTVFAILAIVLWAVGV